MNNEKSFESWMKAAIEVATDGAATGESPFGAAIIDPSGHIIACEHNQVRSQMNPIAHAEVRAIEAACEFLGELNLANHTLVATGEPCPMCLTSAAMAGIDNVVFGASAITIEKAGYATLGLGSRRLADLLERDLKVHGGILAADCGQLLLNHPK